ncbi:MAG: DNA mismatch repair protein MutS [Geminicoccaceae bacterium]|nr:DNA mismatch repair protein MutS [Geminicoccaceae bacterium]
MMAQYRALKAAHPGMLLFFRMGDFYELFFEDAEAAASILDIALTKRGKAGGVDVPMCGVPVHSAEGYLERLIRSGQKVAVCEQMEDPAAARRRGGKPLVRRDVVRIVTPGTITEDGLLPQRASNHLAALARIGPMLALAWADLSTGAFATEASTIADLGAVLARVAPGELLLDPALLDDPTLAPGLAEWRPRVTALDPEEMDGARGASRLKAHFNVATLDGFGRFERAELAAAGALLGYLEATQKGAVARLDRPRRVEPGTLLKIDPATRRSLELLQGPDGGREGSLLAAIDRTRTGAGGRLLAERLAAPLATLEPLERHHDEVAAFLADGGAREAVRDLLKGLPDPARALSRLALGRGGPRDLWCLGQALARAGDIATALAGKGGILAGLGQGIGRHDDLAGRLLGTLIDQPPPQARDGGFVREGAVAALDGLRALRDQSRRRIAEMEADLKAETGIPSLKIRHNNLIGYHIEVTANHLAKVPAHFVRRQGLAAASRYTTEALSELERRIDGAAEEALALELATFEALRGAVLEAAEAVARTAAALAGVDVAAAWAEIAAGGDWTRPRMEAGTGFHVEGGRHPVVEAALKRGGQPFVANDCRLEGEERLWLVTGPNMAGKSTFLRQNALMVVLAQAGGFVPAKAAAIGLVDRLFSRVGAADDLARGRSTFMVEMVETAAILNQATARSLVILDEIGRGTATYDGLSLAWAILEHLHKVGRCRGLFATHYHELTALCRRLDGLASRHVRVEEWGGEVVFLHEVADGAADRSYGVHVARLAGLPEPVLRRAEAVLRRLEGNTSRTGHLDDLPLFQAAPPPPPPVPSPIAAALAEVDPDTLSARAALDLVYALKRLAEGRA